MPIVPEDKDWMWVLERPCPACGFDGPAVDYAAVPDLVRAAAGRFGVALTGPGVAVRPNDSTWSPLEYAAHVRDVCRIFAHRLDAALSGVNAAAGPDIPGYDPTVTAGADELVIFANWDQDDTAEADGYRDQDPVTVATQLAAAAEIVSRAFESVPTAARARAARRSNGSLFTIESMSRYFLHDLVHHLHDIGA